MQPLPFSGIAVHCHSCDPLLSQVQELTDTARRERGAVLDSRLCTLKLFLAKWWNAYFGLLPMHHMLVLTLDLRQQLLTYPPKLFGPQPLYNLARLLRCNAIKFGGPKTLNPKPLNPKPLTPKPLNPKPP